MGWPCSKNGVAADSFVWKLEGKRSLGRSKRRWQDNIKTDGDEIRWGRACGWNLLRMATYGGLLWLQWHTLRFERRRENSWPTDGLQASQRLCSVKLECFEKWIKDPFVLQNFTEQTSYKFSRLQIWRNLYQTVLGFLTSRTNQLNVVVQQRSFHLKSKLRKCWYSTLK
jgi:hypothetical protein